MKVKLNIARLSLTDRIARCRQIVTSMTGNANFTTPHPALAAITTALDESQAAANAAQAARQDAKAKTAIQNDKDDVVTGLMNQLAAYVESIAGGDEAIIRSAGMDTKATGSSPTTNPDAPDNLSATAGDRDGEIDLSWEAVSGAKSYVIEQSADPPTDTSWAHAGVSTRSSQTIDGLKSGTRYWFRVAAVNGVGQGGWSDPAMKIAP
ncbi:MAG TPA: fibronectin type III domain-containing protein [Pyrinomonadaceae bacterium]|nr:fibronectin type III domain-containing protein [Pyrinomonadaceae bacterium]